MRLQTRVEHDRRLVPLKDYPAEASRLAGEGWDVEPGEQSEDVTGTAQVELWLTRRVCARCVELS